MSEQSLILKILNPYPVSHEALVSIIPGQRVTIGRGEQNDVVVLNDYVSRQHLTIAWEEKRVMVRDLKSLNGTRLNGKSLKGDIEIKVGDQLELSNVKISLLPGSGGTQLLDPEAINAAKSEIGERAKYTARENSPWPTDQIVQSNVTLACEAPVKGSPFVTNEGRKKTLWRDDMSQELVAQIREATEPEKRFSLMMPLAIGALLSVLYFLFF